MARAQFEATSMRRVLLFCFDVLIVAGLSAFCNKRQQATKLKQFIESNRDKISYPDYLPLYHKMAVDNEDNILIYLKNWEDASDVQFLVYSKNGDYLCKTKLNCLEYRPAYPTFFFENHIYTKLIPIDENKPAFLAKVKLN